MRTIGLFFLLASSLAAQGGPPLFAPARKAHLPFAQVTTHSLAVGDLNGNGRPDLVAATSLGYSPAGGRVRVYLNQGDANFIDVTQTHLPGEISWPARKVALADVDGDGFPDLIVLYGIPGETATLHLNDGSGRFRPAEPQRLPALPGQAFLAIGDVTGNGAPDLVFRGHGPAFLFLNDGKGFFRDATAGRLPPEASGWGALALADVDGDGDLDLLFANGEARDLLFLNDGRGTFAPAPFLLPSPIPSHTSAFAVGDLDGNGRVDIVVGTSRWADRILINQGQGRFVEAPGPPLTSSMANAVALADFDGDGSLDLVVASRNQNRLYLNDGQGRLTDVTQGRIPWFEVNTLALAVADFDGDGDLDLLFGNGIDLPTDRGVDHDQLLLNDGRGTFIPTGAGAFPRGVPFLATSVALGDLDGDGFPDLVVGGWGPNQLFRNDGKGAFSDRSEASLPANARPTSALVLGDLDGDGHLDLIEGVRGHPDRVYLNDGKGGFRELPDALPNWFLETTALVLGDVDGDGHPDLIVATPRLNRLLFGDGKGFFQDATAGRLPALEEPTTALALGDVNGNGHLDLVVGNGFQAGHRNRLFLNDGQGFFREAPAGSLPEHADTTRALLLWDVNGNGHLDLLVGNYGYIASVGSRAERNRLYLNDGRGRFVEAPAGSLPPLEGYTHALALIDLDGDGHPDLVEMNANRGLGPGPRLYRNDGTGRFQDVTEAWFPGFEDLEGQIALGDVDGDGDPDLVIAGASPEHTLLLNLTRQLIVPYFPRLGRTLAIEGRAREATGSAAFMVAPFLGFTETRVPMPPFGVFGLDPAGHIEALPATRTDPSTGLVRFLLPIPSNPELIGLTFHLQALVEGRTAAGPLWRFTPVVTERLYRF